MKTIFVLSEDHTEQYVLIGTAEQILDYMLNNAVTIIDTARIINLSGGTESTQEPQEAPQEAQEAPQEPQQPEQPQQPEEPRLEAWQREQAAMVYAFRKMHTPKMSQKLFSDLIRGKFDISICQTEISKVERGKRTFTKQQWKQIKTLFTL